MQKFYALTTRGLETVSAQEIAALASITVDEIAYRRVAGRCEGSLAPLMQLRTVDDAYLEAARWSNIGHTRDTLMTLQRYSERLELDQAAAACATLRPISPKPAFSVTASFVGRRNYSTNEIKNAVADGVLRRYPWTYTPGDQSADLNIRLFIEHESAVVGVRLAKTPLGKRSYKQIQRPGSLKPPVAAAMLLIGGVKQETRVLDPCCGVGTILIEAAIMGAGVMGGDIVREAVAAAKLNATAAGIPLEVGQWDARQLPLPDGAVDCVATNLPWGQQTAAKEPLSKFYQDVAAEIRRVLSPRGRAVVLSSTPELLEFPGLYLEQTIEISLFGQIPTIAVFSPTRQTTRQRSGPGAPVT